MQATQPSDVSCVHQASTPSVPTPNAAAAPITAEAEKQQHLPQLPPQPLTLCPIILSPDPPSSPPPALAATPVEVSCTAERDESSVTADTPQATSTLNASCVPYASLSTSPTACTAPSAQDANASQVSATPELIQFTPSIQSSPVDPSPAAAPTSPPPPLPAPPPSSPSPTSITRTTRSTTIPTDFFARLHSRSNRSAAAYFQSEFLSSSPICDCGDFPVYSTKVGQLTPGCKLKAVDNLCLYCINHALIHRYGTEPEIGDVFWTAELENEFQSYYLGFYTAEELEALDKAETEVRMIARYERTMLRFVPWLQKRGVRRTCPHTGSPTPCTSDDCLRGTEPIPAANC